MSGMAASSAMKTDETNEVGRQNFSKESNLTQLSIKSKSAFLTSIHLYLILAYPWCHGVNSVEPDPCYECAIYKMITREHIQGMR